jgi:hypothetical protein
MLPKRQSDCDYVLPASPRMLFREEQKRSNCFELNPFIGSLFANVIRSMCEACLARESCT